MHDVGFYLLFFSFLLSIYFFYNLWMTDIICTDAPPQQHWNQPNQSKPLIPILCIRTLKDKRWPDTNAASSVADRIMSYFSTRCSLSVALLPLWLLPHFPQPMDTKHMIGQGRLIDSLQYPHHRSFISSAGVHRWSFWGWTQHTNRIFCE